MKVHKLAIPLALVVVVNVAQAQTHPCRSAAAAARGGQLGLDRDRTAFEHTAQNEKLSSEILGRCVAGVSMVFTTPQFPSFADIFNQIKNRVCRIASDSVSNAVNGVVTDVNGQINGVLNGINGQINTTGLGQVTGAASPQVTGGTIGQTSNSTSAQSTQFWSDIWR